MGPMMVTSPHSPQHPPHPTHPWELRLSRFKANGRLHLALTLTSTPDYLSDPVYCLQRFF